MQSLQPEPSARYRNVMDALRQIVRTEGVWRPIRGVNVLAVGAGPAHALYFACYEKIKFSLSDAIHPGANSHFANGETPHVPVEQLRGGVRGLVFALHVVNKKNMLC